MLLIENIDDFRAALAGKEEIREMTFLIKDQKLSCFCYMISEPTTFDTKEGRECRGIVFNKETGAVVSRPLHKFFNVNERVETQVAAIDWTKVVRVMEKRDGSLIHTVQVIDGFDENDHIPGYPTFALKSKKSLDSDVAKAATKLMFSPEYADCIRFCNLLVANNETAIFEYTAPDARIVVAYAQPELRLLHVRDNVTGEYWNGEHLRSMAEGYGVKVVDEPTFDVPRHELGNHLLELAQTVEGIEGWVVQFEDGDMVKLKTKWYMDRHHAMTFLRVRDIAGMVLSESLDDLKAKLVGDGIDISEILSIEHEVVQCLNDISVAVHSLHLANQHLPIKEVAIKFKGHEYFGLLMSRINGREPKIKEYFKKHHLKARFDLRQINLLQSVADTEE